MSEEEMRKRLHKALEQEDLNQLKFPLDREEGGHSAPYLQSEKHSDSKTLYQSDFLTHKINQRLKNKDHHEKTNRSRDCSQKRD